MPSRRAASGIAPKSETIPEKYLELAYSLTVVRGLGLELVHGDNYAKSYVGRGVLEGGARR